MRALKQRVGFIVFEADTLLIEVVLAYGLLAWAWILLLAYPSMLGTSPSYKWLNQIADQHVWGYAFLGAGLMGTIGIFTNSKLLRILSVIPGGSLWGFVTSTFLLTNSVLTGTAIYSMFVLMSFLVAYRMGRVMRIRTRRRARKEALVSAIEGVGVGVEH